MKEMVVEAEVSEQTRATEDEIAVEEAATYLVLALADEKAAAEEHQRKKAVPTKKKKTVASSSEPTTDLSDDIYLSAFHAGASFKMQGDPAQFGT